MTPDPDRATAPPRTGSASLARVGSWRVHLGAHKTATTHLQDTLLAIRPQLADGGVDFIPTTAFRQARGAMHLRQNAADFEANLDPLRSGGATVLISDENQPGLAPALLSDPIYPEAGQRLAGFRDLAGSAPVQFFLGIRPLDEALPSAYATAVRSHHFPDGFAPVAARVAGSPPRWSESVASIRRSLPGIPITVWTFAAYLAEPARILRMVAGCEPGPVPDLPAPLRTVTPSAEAVAEVERLPAHMPQPERKAAAAEIYERHLLSGGGKYSPFSPGARDALRAAFERDLEALGALDGVDFVA